ncbi:MAG: glycosyl transferase [candidate division Zixibacteria bacterium RBG_16_53_22]|nr:MAG: glycosyl transferase [candidate division Zixibacteria bacterium RBG_16_53_22]
MASVGIVAIGRNEGDRLRKCLMSVEGLAEKIVYVDSGSTDGSVGMARSLGVTVVELDLAIPFTAARARNEGFKRLRETAPELDYVQFVDGDCEVAAGWLEKAARFLDERADVAVVCGRRRERFPERSVYNMLCDIEWDTPVGEAKSCGGDAMMRTGAFERVGKYRDSLIAGEEPELCVRLRAAGWKIWRLGKEMTLHDAAITRFRQWWKRTLRCGYAYAEGAHLHGAPPEMHRVKESRRVWIWGLGIPVIIFISTICMGAWGLAMLLIYPAQIIRLTLSGTRSRRENWWRALFLVLGKFPEAIGQLNFLYNRLAGKTARLIEYK